MRKICFIVHFIDYFGSYSFVYFNLTPKRYSSPRDLATFLSFLFHSSPKGGSLGGLESLWEFLAPGGWVGGWVGEWVGEWVDVCGLPSCRRK